MSRFLKFALAMLASAACSSNQDFSNLSASNNADDFLLIAQTFDRTVTTTLHYSWQITGSVARVTTGSAVQSYQGGSPSLSGSSTLTIHDPSGAQVYTHSLNGTTSDTTASGATGNWSIDLTFAAVQGDVVLEITKAPRDLTVQASTTGSNLPTGYMVTLDGGTGQQIGANASVVFSSVSAASHTVVLSGVAANCSVSGSTSRSLTVPAATPTTVTFSVTCV